MADIPAGALWPILADQMAATNMPSPAVRTIGIPAPTTPAGTTPMRTMPNATAPTMKLGNAMRAGSPASVPAAGPSDGGTSRIGWSGGGTGLGVAIVASFRKRSGTLVYRTDRPFRYAMYSGRNAGLRLLAAIGPLVKRVAGHASG